MLPAVRTWPALLTALLTLAPVAARAGTGFVIRADALASAGGTSTTGPHVLGMTLGQTFTGPASSVTEGEYAGFWRPGLGSLVDVEPGPHGTFPASLALAPVAPNPSRGPVNVRLALPIDEPAESVRLRIFDVSGRMVTELPVQDRGPGWQTIVWDGHGAAGRPVGLGLYFLRMDAGEFSAIRRFVIFR